MLVEQITAELRIDKVTMRIYNIVGLQTNEIDLYLLNGAQQRLEVSETVELPPIGGLTFPYPIPVALVIERTEATLMIAGTADVRFAGECDRCLGTFEVHRVYSIDESFTTGPTADPFDESNVVRDDKLDLTDLIRQVVDAALPLVMLCRKDCAGLCATCGSDLNEGSCDCGNLRQQTSSLPTKGDHG